MNFLSLDNFFNFDTGDLSYPAAAAVWLITAFLSPRFNNCLFVMMALIISSGTVTHLTRSCTHARTRGESGTATKTKLAQLGAWKGGGRALGVGGVASTAPCVRLPGFG